MVWPRVGPGLDDSQVGGHGEQGPLPPPDNLGLHMVKSDRDTGRLALYHVHNVLLVQHSRCLFQGWAWGRRTQALCQAGTGATVPFALSSPDPLPPPVLF